MSVPDLQDLRRRAANGLPALAFAALLGLSALVVTLVTGGSEWRAQELELATARGAQTGAVEGDTLRLPGYGPAHAAARLRITPAARAPGRARQLVWVARDPVAAIWLQAPGWRSGPLDFFAPDAAEGPVPVAYLFPLPDAFGADIELHASSAAAVSLHPRLVSEDEALRWTQRVVALNVLTYSGAFCLALLAMAMLWTVRERFFLTLFAAAASAGLLFAASNGQLYALPGLRVFGALGVAGLWSLSLLCMAALLALVAQVARVEPTRVPWLRGVLVGLAAAALLVLPGFAPLMRVGQQLAESGFLVAGLAALVLLVGALRERTPMVLPALVLLVLALGALAARVALGYGLIADVPWTRYGYQVALLALLVVLALGLITRIGSYREQRDRERDARVDSERRMQREAGRTALTRVLQARLRELAPADIEWTAFRLMLEHLLPHVPADRAAVIAHGYHGRDVVVAEPIDDRQLIDGLEGTRLLMLKRQSLAGRPMQQAATLGGRRGVEALVPMSVDPQGWGALLLQRDSGKEFSDEELSVSAEFVRLTTLHANEAVATQALRRTAELDALTGTMNRRSIDQWLARHFVRRAGERRLSLLFVDIDYFKRINDVHGHACGDHCLRAVAIALRSALRPQDVLGRYGGEEFIALLPDCDVATARGAAERLRLAVEDCVIEWQGSRLRLSVSIGVATRDPGEQAAELLDRADRALYVAKRAGRNRVSVSPAVFPG
jgi:diguanylate cyclase (GGDEF)-like protein